MSPAARMATGGVEVLGVAVETPVVVVADGVRLGATETSGAIDPPQPARAAARVRAPTKPVGLGRRALGRRPVVTLGRNLGG
jgi:hypothetical protein